MTIVLIFAVPISFIKKQLPGGVFYKKGVLRNFTNFTGKHRCQSLFFNKVAGLRPANLLKKSLWHGCFPVNFAKFLRTLFFTEHLRRLVLFIHLDICVKWYNMIITDQFFVSSSGNKYQDNSISIVNSNINVNDILSSQYLDREIGGGVLEKEGVGQRIGV